MSQLRSRHRIDTTPALSAAAIAGMFLLALGWGVFQWIGALS